MINIISEAGKSRYDNIEYVSEKEKREIALKKSAWIDVILVIMFIGCIGFISGFLLMAIIKLSMSYFFKTIIVTVIWFITIVLIAERGSQL